MEVEDKIIIRDFWDPGEHLYEHRLGWQPDGKAEGRSIVSKELFDSFVVRRGLNLAFYYVDNDTFYGLHRERCPIELKILPRDRSVPYLDWQCDCDTHDDGEVVCSFADENDLWDGIKIDGKSLEEVLERSVIISIN